MRAVVYRAPGEVTVEALAAPEVGPRDVLLAVDACGVCGSDLASYGHGHYVEPGQVMGHEIAARVAVLGSDLTGLEVGEKVAVRPMRSCGTCPYCRDGDTHLCGGTAGRSLGYGAPGGFADLVLLRDVEVGRDLIPVPKHVAPLDLMWAEPLAVAVHAVGLTGLGPGDRLLVTGAGAVGLTVTAAATARGVGVTVVEPVAGRRTAAQALGASAVAPGGLERAVLFDAACDASGVPAAVSASLPFLRPGAPVVLVGLGDDPVPWPVGPHPLVGAFAYRDPEFAHAVELIASGAVRLGRLVTHCYPLHEADLALRGPALDPALVKAAITPHEENR